MLGLSVYKDWEHAKRFLGQEFHKVVVNFKNTNPIIENQRYFYVANTATPTRPPLPPATIAAPQFELHDTVDASQTTKIDSFQTAEIVDDRTFAFQEGELLIIKGNSESVQSVPFPAAYSTSLPFRSALDTKRNRILITLQNTSNTLLAYNINSGNFQAVSHGSVSYAPSFAIDYLETVDKFVFGRGTDIIILDANTLTADAIVPNDIVNGSISVDKYQDDFWVANFHNKIEKKNYSLLLTQLSGVGYTKADALAGTVASITPASYEVVSTITGVPAYPRTKIHTPDGDTTQNKLYEPSNNRIFVRNRDTLAVLGIILFAAGTVIPDLTSNSEFSASRIKNMYVTAVNAGVFEVYSIDVSALVPAPVFVMDASPSEGIIVAEGVFQQDLLSGAENIAVVADYDDPIDFPASVTVNGDVNNIINEEFSINSATVYGMIIRFLDNVAEQQRYQPLLYRGSSPTGLNCLNVNMIPELETTESFRNVYYWLDPKGREVSGTSRNDNFGFRLLAQQYVSFTLYYQDYDRKDILQRGDNIGDHKLNKPFNSEFGLYYQPTLRYPKEDEREFLEDPSPYPFNDKDECSTDEIAF